MSNVISFRLDKENPREARALDMLRIRIAEGFSVRHILTEALLNLENHNPDQETLTLELLNDKLSQISKQLMHIGNGRYHTITKSSRDSSQQYLADTFIASVKKATKSGLKFS